MHSLKHAAHIATTAAADLILDGCRLNASRWVKTITNKAGQTFSIEFDPQITGDHIARAFDENGFLVAVAWVDKFDN